MMSDYVSTVVYRSNLQPAGDILIQDENFHSKIHDPFSLRILEKNAYLTSVQKEELRQVATHCSSANEAEYPYGTVCDKEGNSKVICRCSHISCPNINECNPSLDMEKVQKILEQNKQLKGKIADFYSEDSTIAAKYDQDRQESFTLAFAAQEPHPDSEAEPVIKENTAPVLKKSSANVPNPFLVAKKAAPKPEKKATPDEKPATTGFESFKETTQQEIIISPITERTIVNAGPGTGKTWTLIEKIIHLINENKDTAEDILVLCFSKSAVDVIQKRLAAAADEGRIGYEWQNVDIRTFDSFATYMLSWVSENLPKFLPKYFRLDGLDYDARIKQATDVFAKDHDMLSTYEHIIVDEVQDLVGYRAQLVIEMLKGLPDSCGFTLLGDSCQSLYDYVCINNPELISSTRFYQILFKTFPTANYLSLTENHRQGDELGTMTLPYRKAILTGSAEDRSHIAADLMSKVKAANVKLQHFEQSDALSYLQNGTLGILTRSNAQALQISSWLRINDIPHALQRPKGAQPLALWISSVLSDYENKSINEAAFIAAYLGKYPDSDYETAQLHWNALINCQSDEYQSHYEVEDLLKGLLHNARDSLLCEDPDDQDYMITVSTIHRAKGSEFDSVLVLDDVISAMTDPEKDDLIEHKVCYVALTRPRKAIQSVHLSPQYIYTAKNETRRCFKAGGHTGRKFLSHFETGYEKDILATSTAMGTQCQSYIVNELRPGDRLRLVKCSEAETREVGYIRYKVVPEDNEHMILAYTSPYFAHEMEKAIRTIFNNAHCEIIYKYYPRRFSELYVNRLITHISIMEKPLPATKSFGDVQIWAGFTVSGFAAMERDFY